jgi:hypothetical protein
MTFLTEDSVGGFVCWRSFLPQLVQNPDMVSATAPQ